jgi:hypothetical protein
MSWDAQTVVSLVPIVGWSLVIQLWLISICHRKRRHTLARIGYVGLVVPGLFVFPLVGAIRLAPPSSRWAVMHYRDDLIGESARRYPDDHDVAVGFWLPKPERTTWENLILTGMVFTGLVFIAFFRQTDWATTLALVTLAQLTCVSWLAEVELAAKPYTVRHRTPAAPTPQPVQAAL